MITNIITTLSDLGINPTRQRVEIGEFLFSKPQHLTAEQLMCELKSQASSISKATIYNTLNLFAEKGLIRELVVDANKVIYDSNTTPHHHIYNVDEGSVTDLDDAALLDLPMPNLPEDLEVLGVDVIYRVRSRKPRH